MRPQRQLSTIPVRSYFVQASAISFKFAVISFFDSTYLRPSVYQRKHGSWTWGGGIGGALAPVVVKFVLHGDFDELGVGWGIEALVGCAVGLFVGGQLFESAYYTVDD